MIKYRFYEFWPHDREYNPTIIVEFPKLISKQILALEEFITEEGFSTSGYKHPLEHPTLESATARERGCDFMLKDGIFTYHERPGNNEMEYCKLDKYNSKKYAETSSGIHFDKYVFIGKEKSKSFLESCGIPYTIIISTKKPYPEFDGTICRECNYGKNYAEPDLIVNDGMFTCYMCRDKLKRYSKWPYSKEHIEKLEESAKEND